APAAAPTGTHDHFAAHRHRAVHTARRAKFALSRLAQQIHSVFPSLSAPESPRRTLISLHQLKIPFPFHQVAHAHVDAQTATIFSRSAGIRPQRAALDQDWAFELDAFD